jgi:hypothetical protein
MRHLLRSWGSCTVLKAARFALILGAVVWLSSQIHYYTYIYQVTTLGDWLRPTRRSSCVMPSPPANLDLSLPSDNTKSGGEEATHTHISADKWVAGLDPSRVGILLTYDSNYGLPDKHLVSRILTNRREYCYLHGYSLLTSTGADLSPQDRERPPAWSKLTALLRRLETRRYDYIVYMDMDMIIMNPSVKLEALLAAGAGTRGLVPQAAGAVAVGAVAPAPGRRGGPGGAVPPPDITLTSDWSGTNTGILMVRNTPFSRWFLSTAWDQVCITIIDTIILNIYTNDAYIPVPAANSSRK